MKQEKKSMILILRCWQEDTAVSESKRIWRFRLETPASKEALSFSSTEAVIAHLQTLLNPDD